MTTLDQALLVDARRRLDEARQERDALAIARADACAAYDASVNRCNRLANLVNSLAVASECGDLA